MEAARYLSPSPAIREMAPSIMEARLASLLDTEPDGIIVIDEQAHILVFNKACERLFGYSAKEVAGRDITLLMVEEEDKHGRDPLIGNAMHAGDWQIIGVGREVKSRHRDGTIIPIELAIGVALTPDGRQFICVLRDLRPRQESDQRLAELRADLVRLGRLSAIDKMGLAIAHELNQPLTALLLYLQSMKRIDEPSSKAEAFTLHAMIDKTHTEAERACAIIHRIRKFVEKRMPERRLVDLPPLIDDAIDFLEKQFDAETVVRHVRETIKAQRRRASSQQPDFLSRPFTGHERLTRREREVLAEITSGASNKEAGNKLGISPRTIEVHRAHVMEKLNARNTADLVRIVLSGERVA
jgi:PAS domain S-box-containing protein